MRFVGERRVPLLVREKLAREFLFVRWLEQVELEGRCGESSAHAGEVPVT